MEGDAQQLELKRKKKKTINLNPDTENAEKAGEKKVNSHF